MVMGVKTVILCILLHFTELKQEHSIKIDPYRITSTGETNKQNGIEAIISNQHSPLITPTIDT
jgi:hypothetical protein